MVVSDIKQEGATAVEEDVGRQSDGLPPPCQVRHARIEQVVLVMLITRCDGLSVVIVEAGLSHH